jgi:hypothetical protein
VLPQHFSVEVQPTQQVASTRARHPEAIRTATCTVAVTTPAAARQCGASPAAR